MPPTQPLYLRWDYIIKVDYKFCRNSVKHQEKQNLCGSACESLE